MSSIFIWNPFDEFTALYTGLPFTFPKDRFTEVKDFVSYEPDAPKTWGDESRGEERDRAIIYSKITVDGRRVAMELLDKIDFRDKGIRICEKPEISEDERSMAERAALDYKRRRIEEYRQERIERQAGGHGRIFPDAQIQRWIRELDLEDELVNPRKRDKPLDADTLGEAIAAGINKALNAAPAGVKK